MADEKGVCMFHTIIIIICIIVVANALGPLKKFMPRGRGGGVIQYRHRPVRSHRGRHTGGGKRRKY